MPYISTSNVGKWKVDRPIPISIDLAKIGAGIELIIERPYFFLYVPRRVAENLVLLEEVKGVYFLFRTHSSKVSYVAWRKCLVDAAE